MRVVATILSSVFFVVLSQACLDPPPEQVNHRLTFHVTADGEPLRDVTVLGNGEPLGTTDEEGHARAEVVALPGTLLEVVVRCPDGYRDAVPPIPPITLHQLQSDDPVARERGLLFETSCPPILRDTVVVVRAIQGPTDRQSSPVGGIPIQIDGREVARTDDMGWAHVSVRREPGSGFLLTLNTSERSELSPPSPRRPFVMPDETDVLVYEQRFEASARRGRRRRRPHTGESIIVPAEPPPSTFRILRPGGR